jgi:ERCC4-type nuclease
MTSLSIFKGFSVLRTTSLQETADYIMSMCDKINREIKKGKTTYYSNSPNVVKTEDTSENIVETRENSNTPENVKGYSEFVKKVKRDNITPENIGEILLCQIPGISSVSAQAIMKKFGGSFSKLVQEIETNKDSLKNIVYEKDGKVRKINRNCGESIIKYLCKTDSSVV